MVTDSDYAFVRIPHAILYDTRLSLGAKATYMFLRARCLNKNYCLLGQERLAKEMDLSERTVRRYIAELKDKGLVEIRPRMGTSAVTVFMDIGDLYTTPGIPFQASPLELPVGTDRADLSAGQTCPNDPDTSGSQKRTPVADQEEAGREEEEVGLDLMDELMENDPQIQKAAEHESAQEEKAVRTAKKRLHSPSKPRPIPRDQFDITSSEVPGNIRQWTQTEWATRFQRAAETQGLQIPSTHKNGVIRGVTKIKEMLEEREYKAKEVYELLFRWMIPNWETISKQVFRNLNAGDHRVMTLGLITSRLPAILALRSPGADAKKEAEVLKRLGAKKIKL